MVTNLRVHIVTTIVGIVLAIFVFLSLLLLGEAFHTKDTYKVRALLPTTTSLATGSRVTMAGVGVGKITKLERQGYATLVEMEVSDERVTPIPSDSQVQLRQRTPIGENYVAITPGKSSSMLGEDDVLPISQAGDYVDVDQLLSVFQGPAEVRTRKLIRAMGGALDDRGQELNDVLGHASNIVRDGGTIFTGLDRVREQTASLVNRLGRVSAAIGERGEAIRVTANRGLAALQALATRDDELRATLDVLPSTLAQVRETATTLRSTSAVAAPVVSDLAGAMRDLRPAIANLQPAAEVGRGVVGELGRAADPLRRTFEELERTAGPLGDALPGVRRTLCQVNPVVRYAAPYAKDIATAIMGLGSASNSYDAIGHLIRLTPIIGENSSSGSQPPEVSQASFDLLHSGLFVKGYGLTWNPYPKAGMIGLQGAKDTGNLSGPDALRESGYKFPRIHADC
jgi:virulence factor Mce-like protein